MTKEEIQSHWEYVKGVLDHEIPDGAMISKEAHIMSVGFHYMTAMEHGCKHTREELKTHPDPGTDFLPGHGNPTYPRSSKK